MASNTSMDRSFLQRLSSLLDAHLGEEHFGVRELAREIGLSKSQLLRKLQTLKGKSTSQYIREYRLNKAMDLLKQDAGTVSEIAYRVGFSSPTYFSTCFHEYFGYPPGEVKFRNSHVAEDVISIPQAKAGQSKKRVVLLFVLGLVLLMATSFILYLGANHGETYPAETIPASDSLENTRSDKSIGVLPFANLSGNEEFDYVSEGMTGAIIDKLTRIESFKKVVPFTTMATFKETDKSVREIATELGITHLLEGNLQKAGDTIRIILRLIDGTSESYDWTEEYTVAWEIDELFKMQAEIAENVTEIMNLTLTSTEAEAIDWKPTENKEAYQAYLKGKYQYSKYGKNGIQNAKSLYQQALNFDENFIDAHIGLAALYVMSGAIWGIIPEQLAWKKAKKHIISARQLDHENGMMYKNVLDNYLFQGVFYYEWDFEYLEKYYLDNENQFYMDKSYGFAYDYVRKTGRFSEALAMINFYIEEEPNKGVNYAHKAVLLHFLNKTKEAVDILEQNDSLFSTDLPYSIEASKLYYYLGYHKKSKDLLSIWNNELVENPPIVIWLQLVNASRNFDQHKTKRYYDQLIKRYENLKSGSPAWFTALYYSVMGNREKTIEWLQKSYDQHEVEMTWLYAEPLLEPVKDDPRYIELLHKVGFSKVIDL